MRDDLLSKIKYLLQHEGFRRSPLRVMVRLVIWWLLCLVKKPVTVKIPGLDVKAYLPSLWRGQSKQLFVFRQYYEPELAFIESRLQRDDIFVDVGAAYGIYSLAAAKIIGKNGKVFSLEPAAGTFAHLKKNIVINGSANVTALQLAAADKAGKALLIHHPDHSRNVLSRVDTAEDSEQVRTISLDELLQEYRLDRVEMVKIDVEGAEELVLRGAIHLIRSFKPIIIFEVNTAGAGVLGLAHDGAWQLLRSEGYGFYTCNYDGFTTKLDVMPLSGNVIASHGELGLY